MYHPVGAPQEGLNKVDAPVSTRVIHTLLNRVLSGPSNLSLQSTHPLNFMLFVECGEAVFRIPLGLPPVRDPLNSTVLRL